MRPPIILGAREFALQVRHRFGGHFFVKGFPVPVFLALDIRQIFAFDGASQDHGGAVGGPAGLTVGREQCGDVVSIHYQRLPAEGLPASFVDLHVVLQHGGLAPAEAVDVDGGAHVAQAPMADPLGGFPTDPSADSPSPSKA